MECIKLPISIFCEDFWYLSAIDNYRYPGCTTRTSVPSQPTALQKPSYKKESYLQNKKHPHRRPNHTTTTTTAQPNPTPTLPTPKPNTTTKPNPTQPNPKRKKTSISK